MAFAGGLDVEAAHPLVVLFLEAEFYVPAVDRYRFLRHYERREGLLIGGVGL